MGSWHYAWNGKSEGPVDEETMADLIRAGRVRRDTLVWQEGMASWEPAATHFGFGPAPGTIAAPPPMPTYATSTSGLYAGAPARGFTEAIKVCFRKYATFKGRASRSEYWWFTLFTSLLGGFGSLLEAGMGSDGQALSALFGIATFLPSIAVAVRRLHDTDHSGWWIGGFYIAIFAYVLVLLAAFADSGSTDATGGAGSAVAAIGGLGLFAWMIALLVFMVKRGTPGPNRFG